MWKHKLLLFCISSLFFTFIQGENNDRSYRFTAQESTNDFFDPVVNVTETSQVIHQTEIVSDNSIEILGASTEETLKKLPYRIVNGTRAILGQFPQQVSLRRRYTLSHFCGGSILSTQWILTAGHCMMGNSKDKIKPYTIIVIAGEIALKNINNARQWSSVKRLIVHPEFDVDTLQNDVALLQLKSPFTIDAYVKPALVAHTSMKPRTICQVSGWGYEKFEDHVVSNYLMYADIPLMSKSLCRKLMVNFTTVPDGMFCAGYIEGGRDACQGDSGGGMLCKGFLTGVVSGGEGCAWPRLPGLYADVKFYVPWIKQYVDLTENFVSVNPINRTSSSSTFSSPLFGLLVVVLWALYPCAKLACELETLV